VILKHDLAGLVENFVNQNKTSRLKINKNKLVKAQKKLMVNHIYF